MRRPLRAAYSTRIPPGAPAAPDANLSPSHPPTMFTLILGGLIAAPLQAPAAVARPELDEIQSAPITNALRSVEAEVVVYNNHLTFLSSPYLGGRLPGTPGMELAKDYVEHYFREGGLQAPFVDEAGNPSFRQPFDLRGETALVSHALQAGSEQFEAGVDFTGSSLGDTGSLQAPAVFVGYSIERGRDGYEGYEDGDDLTGHIAVMFRFEPMNEEGESLWATNSPWSARAGFNRKIRDAMDKGAAGIVILNPPGAGDPRASELPSFSMGNSQTDVPVAMLTAEAGERLLAGLGAGGASLMDLRRQADAGRVFLPLGGEIALDVEVELNRVVAENVGGLVPGRGDLANEVVVVGAHLDHLGMGEFGSRDRASAGKKLHPGADDNASGSAAMILIGERLVADYAALPEGASARTVLILCFSAEESGLNGAREYVADPIVPIEDHVLMLNFDMIGRLEDGRLSVSGIGTGAGMMDWAEPFFENNPLTVVPQDGVMAASDHFEFHKAEVPTLFAICDTFHADYHTPADTVDKINRVGAVDSMRLWYELALSMALRPERFEFQKVGAGRRPNTPAAASAGTPAAEPATAGSGPTSAGVTLGVRPAYEAEGAGVLIGAITPDSPAAAAGLRAGDRILTWNGEPFDGAGGLMQNLRDASPGDVVTLGVARPQESGDEEEIELTATLAAK